MGSSIKQLASDLFPAALKDAVTNSRYYELREARRLAATSKRIDICSAQIAHLLHLAAHRPLRDLVCLEIGSGWVLSHALVFYLLGAKRIITTDVAPHAKPRVLQYALKNAITSLPRDLLAPFADHSFVRERMNNLLAIRQFSFEALKSLGIEYISPVDLARSKIDVAADFIYSNSVLEHVPVDDIAPLLANLAAMLVPGGTMIQAIHLEDHRDFGAPFVFLSIPGGSYTRAMQSGRGNRVRYSQWMRLFSEIPQTSSKSIFVYHRRDRALPQSIDPSIRYVDEEDLRVSHLGMLTRKLQ